MLQTGGGFCARAGKSASHSNARQSNPCGPSVATLDAGCGRRGRRPRRRNPVPVADPARPQRTNVYAGAGSSTRTPGTGDVRPRCTDNAATDPPWTAIGARRRDEDQMTPEDTRAATGLVDLDLSGRRRGAVCWARDHHGYVRELPMTRWIGGPHASHPDRLADGHVLRHCSGGQRWTSDAARVFHRSAAKRGWAALG